MTRLRYLLSFAVFAAAILAISCSGDAQNDTSTPTAEIPQVFTGDERAIVQEQYKIWNQPGHLGTFQEAADKAGVMLTDSLRADLLTKMEANLMMHDQVARYRPYTFALTNDEKRIANYIRHYEQTQLEFPPLDTVAAHVDLEPTYIRERLQFLARLGMFYDLGSPDDYNALGFSYGNKLGDFTYDLGTHVHTMQSGNAPAFNVDCAKEALMLVVTEYGDDDVTYHSYDPISLEPITVEFKDGKVAAIAPEGVIIFVGGTCGTNNMFTSRENAQQYASRMPQWQSRPLPISSIEDALAVARQEYGDK